MVFFYKYFVYFIEGILNFVGEGSLNVFGKVFSRKNSVVVGMINIKNFILSINLFWDEVLY